MVTTTTKVLSYPAERGNRNAVNATFTSTPGFNSYYLARPGGILKLLQLLLTSAAVGLIGYLIRRPSPHLTDVHGNILQPLSYPHEALLYLDSYFLGANYAILTTLVIFAITHLFSILSAMVISKTSIIDMVMNITLAFLALSSAILEIVQTFRYMNDERGERVMTRTEEFLRFSAGAVTLLNGVLFIISFGQARKDVSGPRSDAPVDSLLKNGHR